MQAGIGSPFPRFSPARLAERPPDFVGFAGLLVLDSDYRSQNVVRWPAILMICGVLCCSVLILGSGFGNRPEKFDPKTPRFESREVAINSNQELPDSTDGECCLSVAVPAGATVLIGSLDTSGAIHCLHVGIEPVSTTEPGGVQLPAVTNADIVRLQRNETAPACGIPSHVFAGHGDSIPVVSAVRRTGQSYETNSAVQRRFRVPYFTAASSHDRYISAAPLATGPRIQVYAEEQLADLGFDYSALAKSICRCAETHILDYVAGRIGPIADVDGDGRLAVVLTSLTDARQHGSNPIRGCVRGDDFTCECGPFGGDIVYLDAELMATAKLDEILAHEFTHAAVFSLGIIDGLSEGITSERTQIPRWLNEAIAHVVELEIEPRSENLRTRCEQFLQSSHSSPIVLPESVMNLSLRRGPSRAAGCSFLATVLQSAPGLDVFQLVTTPGSGIGRLRAATQVEFGDLFRNWSLSLLRSDLPVPRRLTTETISLSGTALARYAPTRDDCLLKLRFPSQARLQVTVVESSPARRVLTALEAGPPKN